PPNTCIAGPPTPSPVELLHHPHKILEQIMRIMRPRRRFRVILHAKQRQIPVPHPFQRVVVQIDVGKVDFTLRKGVGINREVMIVRSDLDLARVQLLYRMIAAVVPELELEGFSAQRESGQLVSQANSEDGLPPHEPADVVYRIGARLRITWS